MATAKIHVDLDMNGKKVTNAANGTAGTDLATVSQVAAGGVISSVFGRTGAVVAATNDYTEAQLSFSDITTNNASTTKHGFAPKYPNDATKYLDGTGAYTVPAGGGTQVVDIASFRKTSGNYTLSSATWANLDTGADLVVTAATGDIIEVGMSAVYNNTAAAVAMDVATLVAAVLTNWIGSGELTTTTGDGIQAWAKENATAVYPLATGGMLYTVQAGDISGGTVTLRLRYRRTATNITLFAATANVFQWWAKVYRPVN